MKNKKGFTLVELLVVIAIMAVIALIAVPNVVHMLERGKKGQFVTDAKEMISKAKYEFKLSDIELENGEYKYYSLTFLGFDGKTDGYGDPYLNDYSIYDSFVRISFDENESKYVYEVGLWTANHCLSKDGINCKAVKEADLSIENVIDRN